MTRSSFPLSGQITRAGHYNKAPADYRRPEELRGTFEVYEICWRYLGPAYRSRSPEWQGV
jgi:hypothetical protein